MKTRLLVGGGAILLKNFRKDYSEPASRILKFLRDQNKTVELKK